MNAILLLRALFFPSSSFSFPYCVCVYVPFLVFGFGCLCTYKLWKFQVIDLICCFLPLPTIFCRKAEFHRLSAVATPNANLNPPQVLYFTLNSMVFILIFELLILILKWSNCDEMLNVIELIQFGFEDDRSQNTINIES